jgi:hypothetical protein
MPKYLVELVLIVKAKDSSKAKEIADYIVNIKLPSKIENAIESFRCEEIAEIKEREKICLNRE